MMKMLNYKYYLKKIYCTNAILKIFWVLIFSFFLNIQCAQDHEKIKADSKQYEHERAAYDTLYKLMDLLEIAADDFHYSQLLEATFYLFGYSKNYIFKNNSKQKLTYLFNQILGKDMRENIKFGFLTVLITNSKLPTMLKKDQTFETINDLQKSFYAKDKDNNFVKYNNIYEWAQITQNNHLKLYIEFLFTDL